MSTNKSVSPAEFRLHNKVFNMDFAPSNYFERIRFEMVFQQLVTWFWRQYGVYFYIQKLKLVDEKALLQVYFYKTYLYQQNVKKALQYRPTKSTEGAVDNAVQNRYKQDFEWFYMYSPEFFNLLQKVKVLKLSKQRTKLGRYEKRGKHFVKPVRAFVKKGRSLDKGKARTARVQWKRSHKRSLQLVNSWRAFVKKGRSLDKGKVRTARVKWDNSLTRGKQFVKPLRTGGKKGLVLSRGKARTSRVARPQQSVIVYNHFFTYFFLHFFKMQAIVLAKSLYKAVTANALFKHEHQVLLYRTRFLKWYKWSFDFLFLTNYALTFSNMNFVLPFYLAHVVRKYKQFKYAELFFNILRKLYFYKRNIRAIKVLINGPYNRHGRTHFRIFRIGDLALSQSQSCVMYDAMQWLTPYGAISVKLWVYYSDYLIAK